MPPRNSHAVAQCAGRKTRNRNVPTLARPRRARARSKGAHTQRRSPQRVGAAILPPPVPPIMAQIVSPQAVTRGLFGWHIVEDRTTGRSRVVVRRKRRRMECGHLFHVIVDPCLQGRRYGAAMLAALLNMSFVERKLHRLSLSVFDTNVAAIACYLRAGFRIEGHHIDTSRYREGWLSHYTMALLRREW